MPENIEHEPPVEVVPKGTRRWTSPFGDNNGVRNDGCIERRGRHILSGTPAMECDAVYYLVRDTKDTATKTGRIQGLIAGFILAALLHHCSPDKKQPQPPSHQELKSRLKTALAEK